MSKKRYHNTSTEERQADQFPWQPKAISLLNTNYKIAPIESNCKKIGNRFAACYKR